MYEFLHTFLQANNFKTGSQGRRGRLREAGVQNDEMAQLGKLADLLPVSTAALAVFKQRTDAADKMAQLGKLADLQPVRGAALAVFTRRADAADDADLLPVHAAALHAED